MSNDFFDPPPELQNIVLIGAVTLHQAMQHVVSCENCSPAAKIPFDWILDRVTGRSGDVTDYILSEPGKCPSCRQGVTEKTLVEPTW